MVHDILTPRYMLLYIHGVTKSVAFDENEFGKAFIYGSGERIKVSPDENMKKQIDISFKSE